MQIPMRQIIATVQPDLIEPYFKLGTLKHYRLGEIPAVFEINGVHYTGCQDLDDSLRFSYALKISARVPTFDGYKKDFTNQVAMYHWRDFFDVKKSDKMAGVNIPMERMLENLDFMFYDASSAFKKMGWDFSYTPHPDGARLIKYLVSNIKNQDRTGFLNIEVKEEKKEDQDE